MEEGLIVAIAVVVLTVVIALYQRLNGAKKAVHFLEKKRVAVPLVEKIEISHDTRLFRFGLPNKNTCLGLPIGKHIKVFCPNPSPSKEGEWNGRADAESGKKEIERKYTPTSSNDDLGHFDIVVKVYKGGVHERFPDGGKMSQHLESLSLGDMVDIQGPVGLYEYNGEGNFSIKRKPRHYKHVGMIAGGTGITPMLQVIASVLRNPKDKTMLSLLYANQTESDILVRDMLESFQKEFPDQFRLHYTVDRADDDWKYSTGFINEDMIREHLPCPSEDTVILMCGPPPMIKFACRPNLDKVGHDSVNQVDF
mmetsp:Transcript_17098/g.27656  ORF Transcript_17098/g.27656 Transcript_17098/m.27656 type:complete len:309 (+) Transcript_17098:118-1044(+)|eukprot:CAMPEP_0203755944 /NCGR_PEP_ID=MMETSP0098-20131031/9276_1 /ASSEMBLY_ACC=CAM_ASM_000208 /TAXON_ID=96639 /ORGANISM=" , Strain NY0313808BC1" /LENGTH=308 /DNA_ID=CAMNT_0050647591 /DNA_START=2326 /DNA_END=3252 /DNA_ORIENTATION=+